MSKTTTGGPVLPPVYFFGSMVLMAALHWLVPVAHIFPPVFRTVGGVLIAAGFAVTLWAAGLFNRRDTTIKPFEESLHLVIDGPFKFSRNPIYMTMFLALVGLWFLLGSLTPAIIIPAFVWIIATRFVRVEEQMLLDTFGDEYRAYQQRIRRWV